MTTKTAIESISSKLQLALAKIGRSNGTAPRPSQDSLDEALHYYYVDKTGEAFFKKAAESSLKQIQSLLDPPHHEEIARLIARTKKNDSGEKIIVASAENYVFELSTRKASMSLKQESSSSIWRRRAGHRVRY